MFQDQFTIKYQVEEAGWAVAFVSDGTESVEMSVSYLHNSLLELTKMAISIRNGATNAEVVFIDEPGEHQLRVFRSSQEIQYEVVWLEDWSCFARESWEWEPRVVLSGKTSVRRLVEQITQILRHIHETIGPDNYQERWGHDSPNGNSSNCRMQSCGHALSSVLVLSRYTQIHGRINT